MLIPGPRTRNVLIALAVAGGLLALNAVLLNRMFASEKENSCLQGLLMIPMDRGVLYLGKMLAASVFMLISEAIIPS